MDALQKIFIPLIIIIIISLFINYYCRMKYKENYEFNINGQLVLLLTIVALRFSLGKELPKTHYLNFTDLIFLTAFIVCSTCLLGSIILLRVYQLGNIKHVEKVESYFSYSTILLFIFLLMFSIFISF